MLYEFQAQGYEDMESSTQILINEAHKRGVTVEIIDRKDQILRLTKGDICEYIKDATRTSKSSEISYFMMSNKQVTKQILHEQGFSVPQGKYFESEKDALKSFSSFQGSSIVVKPNTTNFGIGITILKSYSGDDFSVAVKKAFNHDSIVIIEEYVPGSEFRFTVINGKTRAVLERIPANVVGDGEHTIEELVEIKNQDPKRADKIIKPLIFIKLTDVELKILDEQGLSSASVLPPGKQIFLRKNSNVSTGGDSIDMTDTVHPDYLRISQEAAATIEQNMCGVDMIIPDYTKPAFTRKNAYSIIELNFNPAICIHDYPFQGKNRHTAAYVLEMLGF